MPNPAVSTTNTTTLSKTLSSHRLKKLMTSSGDINRVNAGYQVRSPFRHIYSSIQRRWAYRGKYKTGLMSHINYPCKYPFPYEQNTKSNQTVNKKKNGRPGELRIMYTQRSWKNKQWLSPGCCQWGNRDKWNWCSDKRQKNNNISQQPGGFYHLQWPQWKSGVIYRMAHGTHHFPVFMYLKKTITSP